MVFHRYVSFGCDPNIVSAKGNGFLKWPRWPDIG